MPAVSTIFDVVDDPMSADVPLVCGPISYKMYASDLSGVTMTSLPDFVYYYEEDLAFDVYTQTLSKAGTYYLMLDAFYTFLESDKKAYHSKSIIKVVLNPPPPPPVTIVLTPPAPASNTTSSTTPAANTTKIETANTTVTILKPKIVDEEEPKVPKTPAQ
jgi:hypothetical protein